jgi:hypothetical protein
MVGKLGGAVLIDPCGICKAARLFQKALKVIPHNLSIWMIFVWQISEKRILRGICSIRIIRWLC